MLQHEHLLAKIGLDTAENEPPLILGFLAKFINFCNFCNSAHLLIEIQIMQPRSKWPASSDLAGLAPREEEVAGGAAHHGAARARDGADGGVREVVEDTHQHLGYGVA